MWIRTQNRTELVNVINVQLYFDNNNLKNKVRIMGHYAPSVNYYLNTVLLGMYPTLEDGMSEMDKIQESILNNPNAVYEMRNTLCDINEQKTIED